jgi:ABC-type dipeptide transport system, periplasmic component
MGKRLLSFFICIALALSLAGCGGGKDAKPAAGGKKVINIGIMNAPSGFNPLEWSDVAQNVVTAILFLPLVDLDEDMKYVPLLADSIETKDNQTYTVKLNQQAKWTDGKPVTADDVLFTLKLITNPKVASTVASSFNVLEGLDANGKSNGGGDIAGAKKIDTYTVEFKTKKPMDANLFKDAVGTKLKTVPQHVLKDVEPDKLYQHPFMQKPDVTSGAFKLVTYQKGQYVQFAANKDYFKGAPKIDEIFMKILPGPNITAQLQTGEIDMNDPKIGLVPFEDYEKVKALPNVTSDTGGIQSTIQTLMINMTTIPDVRVRKALSYGINRKLVIDNLLKGDGEALEMPYMGTSQFLNKNIPMTNYDPEKAKQLLQEAGWDMSKPINFDVPTGNKVREQVADIITDNLKSLGLNIEVHKYDFVTSLAKAKKGEFDIYIVGIPVYYPNNPDVSQILQTGSTLNLAKYSNQEMDDLLLSGLSATDPAQRKQIYDRLQEIFYRDLPCPSLFVQNALKAVNKRVLVGKPKSFGTFINVEKWDVKQ